MKRVMSLLVCLLLMFSLGISAFAKERILFDFEQYEDIGESTKDEIYVWEEGGGFRLSLTEKNAVSGQALKAVPSGGSFGYIILEIPPEQQDWTGAEYLRFHIVGTGGTVVDPTYVGFYVQFDEASNPDHVERYSPKVNKPYYVSEDLSKLETEPTTMRFAAGGVTLDDGKSLWVDIPMTSLECLGWSMWDDELDLSSVTRLFIALDTDFFKNKDLIIDSISIVGENLVDKKDPVVSTPATSQPEVSSQPSQSSKPVSSVATTPETSQAESSLPTASENPSDVESEGTATSSQDEVSSENPVENNSSQVETVGTPDKPNVGLIIGIVIGGVVIIAAVVAILLMKKKK